MGKRSNFERRPRDFYPTPHEAVEPLLMQLPVNTWFIEPCVGQGDLVNHLEKHGHKCVWSSDHEVDARTHQYGKEGECFITNPPWDRKLLHPIINNLRNQKKTWLLFDTGWMFTKQAMPFLPYCEKIVTVGRVKWIPGSPYGSLDDCAWYLFREKAITRTLFYGKADYSKSFQGNTPLYN